MAKHNWEMLKAEYLAGNIMNVRDFGRMKGISENTLEKYTVGWSAEYGERQKEIARIALARITNRQTSALASRLRAGRLLVAKSMREFEKRSLDKVATKQLAEIAKIGSEIQGSIKDQAALQQQVNIENLQVNNVNGDTITGETLTDLGLAFARAKATLHGRGDATLGA